MEQEQGRPPHPFKFIVNKKPETWPTQFITGAEIKTVAGSPANWVVNQIIPGPGEEPEIGNDQPVDLAEQAKPQGIKKFITRQPTTSPG